MEGEEALGQPMGGEGGSRGRGRGGGRGGSRGGRGGRRPRASSESGEGGEASSKTANKKPRREIPKDSPILALFQSYSATLDDLVRKATPALFYLLSFHYTVPAFILLASLLA